MTDMSGSGRNFDIGRVFKNTFGAVGKNFITFVGLAILLSGLPQALFALAQLGLVGQGRSIETFNPFSASSVGWMIGGGLVVLLGAMVLQAALVHGSIVGLNGRKASFGDCLSTGLRHALPILAITILATLGLMLGLILLVIPFIFLAIIWVVVVPVRVAENTGILQSFSRSAALTEGSRWMILLLFVVYVVLSWIFGAIMMGIIVAVFGATGGFDGGIPVMEGGANTPMMLIQVVLNPLINALSTMVGASGVAAIYYELRSVKEGVVPEKLASVFD